ncbi:TonB-linked SusC/RagA family outer membrane protein [Roseivirga ehrenbergii]|uniref:SusC/RagA family TonB-linked outer membrane protein n=1 Tax=Roseivirga ehrenbergii (strain DSM 102268 / JCM 13514 / KCTC 12282 / NCIMB 14502 / KMM 6017) TaxID=279360 RepID=A0A150X7T3_ROSEK|nr:SusC/RagA family TonB-linked outer membrane protein [Roseivirga ehrenbergii]KYG74722.1 SusC/RagA family TonB-linked outer membrane protein [Roseivirga ehrenbergii]TCL13953.1 TonB-linked SusC/RagA family outer membrane protein [Roseivirga ehrenbergii]
MIKFSKIAFFCLLCIISQQGFAQIKVTGKIVDDTGLFMTGVSILEQGTLNGVASGPDGTYSITVKDANSILRYSFLGFKTVTQTVGNRTNIDITLEEEVSELESVVVTAIGLKEKKDNLGYANTTVEGDVVSKAGEPTLLNGLSGKVSGVRISRTSGDPGAGSFIQIRGLSSITRDSQPLIVVDGVPISNDNRGDGGTGGVSNESRLNDINPNDIENISVLKGASAAALWGTKALGGVIFITTKKGDFNKKLSITYRTSYSLDKISRKYPLQTAYGQGDNGVYNQAARDSWGDKISDRSGGLDEFNTSGSFFVGQNGVTYYPIISKNSTTIYDDQNFDQAFQNGQFLENNISLTAGNDNSRIYFSLSDLDQQGIIQKNSDYRRTTARVNAEYLLSQNVSITANTTYSRTTSNRILKGASSSGFYLGLLRTPADFDQSGYRGDYYASSTSAPISNRHRSYREPLGADNTAVYNNTLWTLNEQENQANTDRFMTNFTLSADPLDWLNLTARVGLDHYTEKKEEFFTPGSAAGAYSTGLFGTNIASNTIFNMDYIATATKTFNENFNGSLLVGLNYNAKKLETSGNEITNFTLFTDVQSPVRDIDNAFPENRISTSTFGQEKTAAIYTSANFSAYDMLYFSGSLRAEKASTFGDVSNKPFYFPSASLAWQFSQLDALQNDLMSFGKLRVSYGEVGVQPARYNTSNVFVSPTYGDSYGGGLGLGFYGNGGFVPSTNRGNFSLKPERKKETEIGMDLRFLKDRLSFSGTYYTNTTSDVLLNFPIANSRGYDEIYANGAEISNKGLELDLGYTIIQQQDFIWQANVIFSKNKNNVENLAGVQSIELGGLAAVNSRAVEGKPIGILWGSRTLRDAEGNIVYDDYGFPEQDQTEGIIGDPNPDWQGSLVTQVSYKNWSLSALFETYQGADIYAGTKSVLSDLGRWVSTGDEVTTDQNLLDSQGNLIPIGTTFRGNIYDFGAGPVALTESWYNGDGGYFSGGNDELYIEDGSWTRLRELTLSYRIKPDWLSKLGISSASLSATGRNLFIWTKFEGNDPDTNLTGVGSARGIDYFNNPGTKSYVFTLTATF